MAKFEVSPPSQIDQWEEAVGKLSGRVQAAPGLMPIPMAAALSQTADTTVAEGGSAPSTDGLAWEDWWQQRERLVKGELSAVDLANASLERLARVQQETAACVELFHDMALNQARESDRRRKAAGSLSPLDGAPLAHKDLVLRSGRSYAYGMANAAGIALERDEATLLRKLDAAGALHLGRLHMTEIAFDPAGVNEMAGHCSNPWSTRHIPGGSSSGSAAAVAAGAVVGAIGSDTGGSIRIPSILCGITGLKPTYGLVGRGGAMSLSHTNDHLGPMARSARDCALLLEAMVGHDSMDAGSVTPPKAGGYVASLNSPIAGLRIGVPESYFTRGIHAEVQAVIQNAIQTFESLGAVIRPVPDFPYDELNALAIMVIRAEATAMFGGMAGRADVTMGAFTRQRLQEGVEIPASLYLRALNLRGPLLIDFVDSVMAEVDVLLAPVFAHPTPKAEEFDSLNERSQFLRQELTRLTRPFNFLGLPSLAVPAGFCAAEGAPKGMPIGYQLIGRPFSEALLLRMGHAFQHAKHWQAEELPMPAPLPI